LGLFVTIGHHAAVAKPPKMRLDTGSRNLRFVPRRRRMLGAVPLPGEEPTPEDIAAVHGPEGRRVLCLMRADFATFPRRWKRGYLQLDESGVRWDPGLRWRSGGARLPAPVRVAEVREVDRTERWKMNPMQFQIVEATAADGRLFFGLPRDSVLLVVERLGGLPATD
jgi:hypothetical protein